MIDQMPDELICGQGEVQIGEGNVCAGNDGEASRRDEIGLRIEYQSI